VKYTEEYPDVPPELGLRVLEDEQGTLGTAPEELPLDDTLELVNDGRAGVQHLRAELDQVAVESLGMPMVFTLASHLREALTDYIARQAKEAEAEASRKRDEELRAEEEKFRGTAVTVERFNAWRIEFLAEQARKREQAENEYIASLSAKEREEYRRMKAKPTGREIFAKSDARVEEEKADDSVKEVDWSLYSREDRERQAQQDDTDEGLVERSDEE